ncbi:MAG TPA: DNA polymerase III subunit alpha, partial [Candidatus Vogelbacteria bacterium]|nr:DNA polymerase III subunit alpha [Candidatus Vogelbacteria bacterium]
MSFVHLHTHSHYSLLDGLSKIDDLIDKALEYEMPALAITDHGNMYGAIEFYKKATAKNIKPIIGVEVYIAPRSLKDKEAHIDAKRYHLTLLAENEEGYHNLMKLVSISHLEGFYYKPRLDRETLAKYNKGIICLSGCLGSEIAQALYNNDQEEAIKIASQYQEIFGQDNYFLEIMPHPEIEGQDRVRKMTIELAKETNIPLVGTYDSHYLNREDAEAHKTLVAIQTNTNIQESRYDNWKADFSFISPEEAKKYFTETPEAVTNTLKIAERCQVKITIGEFIFPNFSLPKKETADQVLARLALDGLEKKSLAKDPEALNRLNYELDIIKMKGYASYFLIVEDLIRYARKNGIYYNIRGSVAGSLVTYSLDITKVDPLKFKIPFERFLNPERPSAPDIDMDFADNRRDEIIEYTKNKYGQNKVAQIGTFGTMMARGAVRDVTRALGYPYTTGDRLSKMIPLGSQGQPITIKRALNIVPELKEAYDKEKDTKKIIDLAQKIEGCARHISVHAAGVVISPKDLNEYTPLQKDPKGEGIISQYDMYSIGEDGIGLTKFDFLGLRNLAILENSIRLVEKTRGKKIDIEKIPLDDKKSFEMLSQGETMGLFQLSGSGMTRWLKELQPTSVNDINAMVALYRPGPMQFIPDYIARKKNPRLIKYLDPILEKILATTYGVLVYQDDLLIMAHDLAGYSWLEVDKFRKAVGKKIPAEMAAQKEKFIQGCVDNSNWPRKKAEDLWTWIEPFASYGFNKAHAASYGRVAYQTAYMKANYTSEFMTAILSAEAGDTEKIAMVVEDCRRLNLEVLPPDINESFGDFTVIKSPQGKRDKIRFGLYTIKNLGKDIADAIVNERKANGHFKDFASFLERIVHKNLNHKSLEALIKTGTFDSLKIDRGILLANIEKALSYNREQSKNNQQESLFNGLSDDSSLPSFRLNKAPLASKNDKLAWEKELLGLYISGHPLENFKELFKDEKNSIGYNKKLLD